MTVHWVRLIRDGQVIEVLDDTRKFLVLRRESNLEMSILTGALTGTLQIEDMRVGDVLDFAFSTSGRDPLLKEHAAAYYDLFQPQPVGRRRISVSVPADMPFNWRSDSPIAPMVERSADGWKTVVFDVADKKSERLPVYAPARYYANAEFLDYSNTSDWSRFAELLGPLYYDAAKPNAEISALARTIAAKHKDKKAQALAALRLAQEEIRYFAVTIGDGGQKPASAEETWRRRFGDCKGKTVLLMALLSELGIEAQPVLVSTEGDGYTLNDRLPSSGWFDHVLVRTVVDGKPYWIDPTGSDRVASLDHVDPPLYYWSLPLRDGKLERIPLPVYAEPVTETIFRIDARNGLSEFAPFEMVTRFRHRAAVNQRNRVAVEGEQVLRERATDERANQNANYRIESLAFEDDFAANTYVLRSSGTVRTRWVRNPDTGRRELELGSFGGSRFPKREGAFADVPVATPHPYYAMTRYEVVLPEGIAGFEALGPNDSRRVTASETQFTAGIDSGVAYFEQRARSLADELPAAEVEPLRRFLEDLQDQRLRVRAPAGVEPPES